MNEKDAIRKELEELAPRLSHIDRKEPFQVPPTYFRELPEEIMEKARRQPTTSGWVTSVINWITTVLTPQRIAWQLATIAVLIAVGLWLFQSPQQSAALPTIADLSVEEMQLYVTDNIDEFDVDILLEESNFTFTDVPLLNLDSTVIEDKYLDEFLDDLDLGDLEKLL